MNTKKIDGVVEFISTKGDRGGIDAQINDWVLANPALTIVDVKYRVAVFQETKLAKLALLLYHESGKESHKSKTKSETKLPIQPPPKPAGDKKPGARTMVMNLRKDLNFDDEDSAK